MALPHIQQAQYGDRVAIDKLGSVRKTNNPAASVQSMKLMSGGRPVETDPEKIAIAALKQAQGLKEAVAGEEETRYNGVFSDLAVQYQTVLKWQRIASQPGAGPFTKNLALAAMRQFARNLMAARQQTPFFDGL